MLKRLIGKTIRVVDDGGVETVLTLAFVAQFAAYALPFHAVSDLAVGDLRADIVTTDIGTDESIVITMPGETGTVVQMPASPSSGRTARASVARQSKGATRTSGAVAPKAARGVAAQPTRVRRPDPVDEDLAGGELEQGRASESSVRITIIGPDGQPRTKIVRLSGSRDGMTAPARRPHD
jgi:hypothetical protein